MNKQFYVYILASKRNGTLYVGVTSNLVKRIFEHKIEQTPGFSKKYGTKMLVYFEPIFSAEEAIRREKQIKAWKREWKLNHIEEMNPDWVDLYEDIL
jgi:putative endonuclease